MKRWKVTVITLALVVTGCIGGFMVFLGAISEDVPSPQKINPTAQAKPTSIIVDPSTFSTIEITRLVNAERAARGLPNLTENTALNVSALAKCSHMVTNNYWEHTAPDGTEPWSFIYAAGYQYSYAGENLGYGFKDEASLVSGWVKSPTHMANLVGPNYSEVGHGICQAPIGYNGDTTQNRHAIIVQHFGAPAN